MRRKRKEEVVNELRHAFRTYDSFFLVDFLKMPVAQFVELRKVFRENSYTFRVMKNRLALRALNEDIHGDLKEYFQGATAVAFAAQNPIALARILKDFSDKNKVLNFKAGLLEGQFLSQEKFDEVARLSSREHLIVKFGTLMAFQLMKFVGTWQAPLNSVGSLLSQLKSKK